MFHVVSYARTVFRKMMSYYHYCSTSTSTSTTITTTVVLLPRLRTTHCRSRSRSTATTAVTAVRNYFSPLLAHQHTSYLMIQYLKYVLIAHSTKENTSTHALIPLGGCTAGSRAILHPPSWSCTVQCTVLYLFASPSDDYFTITVLPNCLSYMW